MTDDRRRERDRRNWWISIVAFLGAFLSDVVANNVHIPTKIGGSLRSALLYQHWALLIAAAGVTGLVVYTVRRTWPERAGRSPQALAEPDTALPPSAPLEGRDDEVRAALVEARRRPVFVCGPSGIGASAVAIAAGRALAADPGKQRYVDLRGQHPTRPERPRQTAIRVLRILGVDPGPFQDVRKAATRVAETLGGTDTVLLLDNAERMDQVSWIAHHIPGAYLIIAGDFQERDLPMGVAHVRVGALPPDAALRLLSQSEVERANDAPTPAMAHPWMGWASSVLRHLMRRGEARNSVERRIVAERETAQELAARYLSSPLVVIGVGRWLAAHTHVTLGALMEDLRRDQGNSELLFILRRQLNGASPGARRLMALLAQLPVSELDQAAVAAMSGTGLERTGEHLAELVDRSLVTWTRPSRCRTFPEARQLADRAPPKALARSQTRLAAHFAQLAAAYAETLAPGHPADAARAAKEWLQNEDSTLLQILSMQDPPRKAAASLWQIAATLDAWFTWEGRPRDRRAAAEAMTAAAASLGDTTAAAVADLRLAAIAREEGDLTASARHLDHADALLGRSGARWNQLDTERTVHFMTIGDLDAAHEHLARGRQSRPRRDLVGRVADHINQAALQIHMNDVDGAAENLNQVLDLTEDDLAERSANVDGQAHAHELLGLVAWRTGHPQRALDEWKHAELLYQRARNSVGEARCLQHRGTAMVAEPALGGPPLADPDLAAPALAQPAGDRPEPAADPKDPAALLMRSLELRGGQQAGVGVALAHLFLAELAARADRPADLTRHCHAGQVALRPWEHQPTEPAAVTQARKRLAALAPSP